MNNKFIKGQSLAEILIAIGVGAILIGGTIGIMSPILRSNLETKNVQIATSLAQQYLDNLRNISEASWFNIYSPPAAKGSGSQFYLVAATSTYSIASGTASTTIESRNFGIYFSIENVNRDSCGIGNISSEATTTCSSGPGTVGVIDDPSTQKINVHISWTQGGSLSRVNYLTRSSNKIFKQTDWSGGGSQDGPITSANNKFASSTSIDYSTTTGSVIIQGLSIPALAPTVSAINPATGVNNASVSITSVTGANFVSGATVKLTKSGQSDISCTGFSFTNSTTLSSGSCPITGAAIGTWDVVVTNPDIQTGTLTNGFTVLGYPSNLALSHSDRNKSFSVSWGAGLGNGGADGCKLQFYTGSTWTDIASSTNLNCDVDSDNASYYLNADGWKSSWNGTQIRLLRKSDSVVMGTFDETLACTTTSGSGTATPLIDEDCNGYWDNTTSYGCGAWGCTQPGMSIEFYHYQPKNLNCGGTIVWQYGGGVVCVGSWTGPYGCSTGYYTTDTDTRVTLLNGSCCAYGYLSTCYTYY